MTSFRRSRTRFALRGGAPSRNRCSNGSLHRLRRCFDRSIHVRVEASDHRLHSYGLAFLDDDLGDHACRWRRNLGIHFVRRNLEDRLITLYRVAHLLQPFRQRPLGDRLAHLGHDNVYRCHLDLLSLVATRIVSPPQAVESQRWQRQNSNQHTDTGIHVPITRRKSRVRLAAASTPDDFRDEHADHSAAEKSRYCRYASDADELRSPMFILFDNHQ